MLRNRKSLKTSESTLIIISSIVRNMSIYSDQNTGCFIPIEPGISSITLIIMKIFFNEVSNVLKLIYVKCNEIRIRSESSHHLHSKTAELHARMQLILHIVQLTELFCTFITFRDVIAFHVKEDTSAVNFVAITFLLLTLWA